MHNMKAKLKWRVYDKLVRKNREEQCVSKYRIKKDIRCLEITIYNFRLVAVQKGQPFRCSKSYLHAQTPRKRLEIWTPYKITYFQFTRFLIYEVPNAVKIYIKKNSLLNRWFSKLPRGMNSYTRSRCSSSRQYPTSFTRFGWDSCPR